MDDNLYNQIYKKVKSHIIKFQAKEFGIYYIPVGVSNRHIHLCEKHLNILFGESYRLTPLKNLSQPGQYACQETITLSGPKGSISNVRILGPTRDETQVEVSITDCYVLGLKPVLRMSGDLDGTPGIKIIGPVGEVNITYGVIVAKRHLHISNEEAAIFQVKNGDTVNIEKTGERNIIFKNVVVRVSPSYSLEFHIDTDEANAALINTGELLVMQNS